MATEILRPNASGSENNINSQGAGDATSPNHYLNVNEAVADDGGTYNTETSAASARDLYALPDSAVGAGTISKVTLYVRGANDGTSSFKGALKSGATIVETGANSPGGTWTSYSTDYTTDPNTGLAWTWSAINALEIGIVSVRNTGYSYITQVYIQITYSAAVTDTSKFFQLF